MLPSVARRREFLCPFVSYTVIFHYFCSKIYFTMKYILPLLLLAVALTAVTACGSKGNSEAAPNAEEVQEQNTQLAEALNVGDLKNASAMADSMSLFVDDFTPEQTVQVLMAFLSVHNDAVAKGERRRDLETLRKYVDVYDIALSVNSKATRDAFAKAKRINPSVDFDSVAAAFRERLTQYDAIQDGSLVAPDPSAVDTVAKDTVAEEIPLELRPAE